MTSKLKRRLENIGIDANSSSSKLNESFCLIGTPLPPLEKTKDTGEFKPLWEQEVRDEKGRRRLHGAFTGGWSAGYFNSVGSKEGWTPSTFVSSRGNRASKKEARMEDFMDDEDLEEMRASQKLIDVSEAGISTSSAVGDADDSMAGALQNLIPPIEDSPGAQLLRKMGWRPGQGVGPRVSYAKLKRQDQLLAGPSTTPSRSDIPDDEASRHTFAPRDTQIPNYPPKGDAFGLGYARGPGLLAQTNLSSEKGPVGPKISAGFGLGALNDADDDDVDVYDTGDASSSRRRLAFQDDEDEDMITLGPAGHDSSRKNERAKPLVSGGVHTFHDGRPVPSGFVTSAKPEVEDTWFKLPEIPKDWRPNPAKLWASQAVPPPKQENVPPVGSTHTYKGKGRPDGMSVDKRGDILGEKRLPAAPRSVFDYLSAKDRERLQAFAIKAKEAASGVPLKKPSPPPETVSGGDISSNIPDLHPSIAKAAMSGFQPFTSEPEKQARYDVFLKYHASPGPNVPYLARRPRQSEEEFRKELQDYAKAAMIFKPVSGVMADRFRTAAVAQDVPKVVEALYYPAPLEESQEGAQSEEDKQKQKEEDADPKRQAARMGMYGSLTRETKEWRPIRLLCKRFGVPDPFMSKDGEAAPETASFGAGGSVPDPQTAPAASSDTGASIAKPSLPPLPAAPGRKDIANIGLGEDESQGQDTLTYERPSMDIFKAIFASDDEDESDDEGNDDQRSAENKPIVQQTISGDWVPPPPSSGPLTTAMEVDEPEPSGSVDTSTFRPTFVPKAIRDGRAEQQSSEKKEKKKKKAKPIVSFAADDEGGDGDGLAIQPKKEKKRRRDKEKEKGSNEETTKKARTEDGDTEMQWVEKEVSQQMEVQPDPVPLRKPGRKTAADFL
ncbi:hypothetical protein FRB90_008487 [Tulasnella sp. 427]|nr:hypothetical protein FRB90_008487 [Tulasnella sp. 427]